MKKKIFEGAATALVTPFSENGINFEEFGKLLEKQIQAGISGLIICGTTGEPATMTQEERTEVVRFAIEKIAGRVPAIIGTGSNSTKIAVENTIKAEKMGADAVLVVTPYYNKCTQEGIVKHYEEIAKNTKLPIIVYNVPGRTGVNILPETAKKLSEIENIVAIKEASGDITQIQKIHSLCKDNLYIYSGNDDQITSVYAVGGSGVISVISNIFPQETQEMCKAAEAGDFKKSLEMQEKYLPVIESLFCETNPIPAKYALKYAGIDGGIPRLPLTELTEEGKKKVDKAIANLKK